MCENELWVIANTYEGNDMPTGPNPSEAGLSENMVYRVIDIVHDADQEAETFLMVINEKGELWSISNRHVRVVEFTDRDGRPLRVFREHI